MINTVMSQMPQSQQKFSPMPLRYPVGSYQDGEASVEPIHCEAPPSYIYLPPKFVPLVIDVSTLSVTARECWNHIVAQLCLTRSLQMPTNPFCSGCVQLAPFIGPTGHPANQKEIPSLPIPS
jgi:hypothetical protein